MPLKAIQGQGNKQLRVINEQQIKAITLKNIYNEEIKDGNLTEDGQKIFKKLEKMEASIDYGNLYYLGGDKTKEFNFNTYGTLASVYLRFVNGKIGLPDINANLNEFENDIDEKEQTEPTTEKKDMVLKNAMMLYEGMKIITDAIKNKLFRPNFNPNFSLHEESNEENSEEPKTYEDDERDLNNFIENKEEDINCNLFKKHFSFQKPIDMLKKLTETKSKKDNKKLVDVIKSRLKDLNKEI